MGIVGDVCRKITRLQPEQITMLDSISAILQFAADIAHSQVTLYAPAQQEGFLVIIAQAKPNTSFVHHKVSMLGSTVSAAEESLVWRTLTSGEHISGQREWALGMDALEMQTFPLYDRAGNRIAVASFEAGGDEALAVGYNTLVETAFQLISMPKTLPNGKMYRPISPHDGIIIIDDRSKIFYANETAASIYKILGLGRIVGRRIYERHMNMQLAQQAAATGIACETELEVGNSMLLQRAVPIIQPGGKILRTILIVADITEVKKKEKELLIKSAVIQEIHHRVKNNLQTIASLLRLQGRRTKSLEVKAALKESVNRILSISVVHEFLSQQDAEFIDVAEVAKNILDLVIQNMLEPDFNIQTVFNGETIILPSEQATSLALVINELIQNSIEHGFVGRHEGVIGIDIIQDDKNYRIDIYDNGIGLPEGFSPQSASGSLGLQIVRTLVETDLGGSFQLYSQGGTRACITIPRKKKGDE
ncbi:MAG: histidine kinase N-terminal domain-containing protein [Negativicutes bacterium]